MNEIVENITSALKSQPALLAVLVLNLIMLFVIYTGVGETRASETALMNKMLEQISRCVGVPTP